MLTMDDLNAVLIALDLAHVQRIILVGDPNQLPPIGMGRPFADSSHSSMTWRKRRAEAKALARLTVEVRTSAGAPSDTLRLASWFTREPQPVDADRVLVTSNSASVSTISRSTFGRPRRNCTETVCVVQRRSSS